MTKTLRGWFLWLRVHMSVYIGVRPAVVQLQSLFKVCLLWWCSFIYVCEIHFRYSFGVTATPANWVYARRNKLILLSCTQWPHAIQHCIVSKKTSTVGWFVFQLCISRFQNVIVLNIDVIMFKKIIRFMKVSERGGKSASDVIVRRP